MVEVVAVLERAIPSGRSRLALAAAEVALPVLDHRWRLLLPANARYRFAAGDLVPVTLATASGVTVSAAEIDKIPTARDPWAVLEPTPGTLTDRINVGGNESGATSATVAAGRSAAVFGTAVDREEEPLPGVTVTLVPRAGTAPLVQVTDAQGRFSFVGLAPGAYDAKGELEGFNTAEFPDVRVPRGRAALVDLRLRCVSPR